MAPDSLVSLALTAAGLLALVAILATYEAAERQRGAKCRRAFPAPDFGQDLAARAEQRARAKGRALPLF